MARATYTDDQIDAAVRCGVWEGVPKTTKSLWTRHAAEWETEKRQAEAEKRDPQPATRVARVLAAAETALATVPDTDGGAVERTFAARARTREAVSREALQEQLSGRLVQLIDYDMERLDELTPGQRRELAGFLASTVKKLSPPAPEAGAAAAPSPFVAILNQIGG